MILVWILVSVLVPEARAQGGFGQRQDERRKESWYFTDHLGAKAESSRQDVLYRFYQSQGKKPRPRVEPFIYGIGAAATSKATGTATEVTPGTERAALTSAGFGGELFFNNFVSGTLGIPTLNIVPGVRGERTEDTSNPSNGFTGSWGPAVRLFGANAQDTALFLSYRNTRRSLLGEKYAAWHWQGGARFYIFPMLAIEGEGIANEGFVRSKTSPLAVRKGWSAGGYLEFAALRAGFRYGVEDFRFREGARSLREERRSVYVGIAY